MNIVSPSPRRRHIRLAAALIIPFALVLTACQTHPQVRTQSAPSLDVLRYQTFGFVEHPTTDSHGYTTLTTRYLEEAVTREMLARGYRLSASHVPPCGAQIAQLSRDHRLTEHQASCRLRR